MSGPPKPNLVQIHPWGLLDKQMKYNVLCLFYLFIYTFFLRLAYRWVRLMVFTRDVPFGAIILKFNVKPLFIPQNRQILAQNGRFHIWHFPLGIMTLCPSLAPKSPKFCITNISFLLETHCSRNHRRTGATNLFYRLLLWYGELLAKNNFRTKIGRVLG